MCLDRQRANHIVNSSHPNQLRRRTDSDHTALFIESIRRFQPGNFLNQIKINKQIRIIKYTNKGREGNRNEIIALMALEEGRTGARKLSLAN